MSISFLFFFFNDTATTEIYTLSLHDALPIWSASRETARPPPLLHFISSRQQLFNFRHNHYCTGQIHIRSEEHTSELQSQFHLVCRLLLEKKKKKTTQLNNN